MIVTVMLVFIHITNGSDTGLLGAIKRLKRQTLGLCELEHGDYCIHGRCVENIENRVVKCVCDKNYLGPTCEHKCSIDCGRNGSCYLHRGQELCRCDSGYSGPRCAKEVFSMMPTVSNRVVHTISRTSLFDSFKNSNFLSANSLQRSHPVTSTVSKDSVSHCGGGFKCFNYGKCAYGRSPSGNDTFGCKCKPGYLKPFCIKTCRKHCKNNGTCLIEKISGKELCGCRWPFSGHDCSVIRM